MKATTYEEWLTLSDSDRQALKKTWNSGNRDSIGIPHTAAGRLTISSQVKVYDMQVGTFHGGEYVLHMIIDDQDLPRVPKMLEQTFEGFRVIWLPLSQFMAK